MSSSITSSDHASLRPFRRYAFVFCGYLALLAAVVIPLSLYKDPYSGDLTRVGGFLDNAYGWTLPQTYFSPPLVRMGDPNRSYDVIVLGDSFSVADYETDQENGKRWTNYLRAASGLEIGLFHINDVSVDELLASPGFLRRPPRALVWQLIERNAGTETAPQTGCTARPPIVASEPMTLRPMAAVQEQYQRPTGGGLDDVRAGETINFLFKWLRREILGRTTDSVVRHRLTRTDLFSNQSSDSILLYRDDLAGRGLSAAALDRFACRISSIQNRVEERGVVFGAMIAPDKASAYRPYIAGSELHETDTERRLAARGNINLIGVVDEIDRLITGGTRDVYLPNDTHWGTAAHRLVGDQALRFLTRRGVLTSAGAAASPTASAHPAERAESTRP